MAAGAAFRHGRLHLRPADDADLRLSRDAGGSDAGGRASACARLAHEDFEAQARDVEADSRELGCRRERQALIEVWNKIDALDAEREAARASPRAEATAVALVSALTGEGIDHLLSAIEDRLARGRSHLELTLDASDGQGLHWLYEHAEVMSRRDEDGGTHLTVRVSPDQIERGQAPLRLATRNDVARLGRASFPDCFAIGVWKERRLSRPYLLAITIAVRPDVACANSEAVAPLPWPRPKAAPCHRDWRCRGFGRLRPGDSRYGRSGARIWRWRRAGRPRDQL